MERLFIIFLILSVLGILILNLIVFLILPTNIEKYSELKENSYVSVSGKIVSIRTYSEFSIIQLDNHVTLTCNCKFPVNSSISAVGTVEKYNNLLQVNSEKIETNN